MTFRPCILVPTYDNPATLRRVVEDARAHLPEIVVVDDGSGEPGSLAARALGEEKLAYVHRRETNGGKGAAVKDGFRVAKRLGYTHALQVDADGQHQLDDIPAFLEKAREQPEALVLGAPVFDESAPKGRLVGRQITRFWTNVETGGRVIQDPMCGFRVYPLDAAIRAGARGDAMDFDPEVAVRMYWDGTPVVNVPTRVRYVPKEEGGVSHFRLFRDNVLISWMHTRLFFGAIARVLGLRRIRRGWLDVAERGGVWGIRLFVWLCTIAGRAPARAVLRIVILYYALFDLSAAKASREYLGRMGLPHGFGAVYRHLLTFGCVALDRLFFVRRRFDLFHITRNGPEHLVALAAQKRGAILLGAHLGSFEAMRAMAEGEKFPINVVGYFKNARMINDALGKIGASTDARLIEASPDGIDFIFKVKECIDRGEMVAILGDRVGLGHGGQVTAPFLGAEAAFPAGGFLLAATLRCPVYLTFGLYRGGNHYDLHCEPFAESIVLPRKAREPALREYAMRYANRLEHYCRLAPLNWFNFFDFWKS